MIDEFSDELYTMSSLMLLLHLSSDFIECIKRFMRDRSVDGL